MFMEMLSLRQEVYKEGKVTFILFFVPVSHLYRFNDNFKNINSVFRTGFLTQVAKVLTHSGRHSLKGHLILLFSYNQQICHPSTGNHYSGNA